MKYCKLFTYSISCSLSLPRTGFKYADTQFMNTLIEQGDRRFLRRPTSRQANRDEMAEIRRLESTVKKKINVVRKDRGRGGKASSG